MRGCLTRHIANLYREGDLEREGTCAKFAQDIAGAAQTLNRRKKPAGDGGFSFSSLGVRYNTTTFLRTARARE